MTELQTAYRQIMKTTSIFGGVQVFAIVISIIRSKFIAVLLGPLGMGVSVLITSTTSMIAEITNVGLSTSGIKYISEANSSENHIKLSIVVSIFKRLILLSGILGVLLTLILSNWLSQLVFDNSTYTISFILVSITVLFYQINAGQNVILRGMRKINYIAKSTMISSIIGLTLTLPLYFLYGIDGIVPGIILSAGVSLLITYYFYKKLKIRPIYISKARTIVQGKGMIKMGIIISISSMITVGASYVVRIFISNTGGVDQVGLYNAGFAIINTYVGMIFTAMGTDYFPRLSEISHSNEKCKVAINQQAEISLLILAPIVMVFLVFINWLVILFYSTQFIPINNMILFAALGMFFKAASWSISFIFLAKGESKLFLRNEVIANIYILLLNIIGYKLAGLTGLGVSFLVSYLLYLGQVYFTAKFRFSFSYTKQFYKIFGIQLFLGITCLITTKIFSTPYSYIYGSFYIIVSIFISYKELNKRIDLNSYLYKFKN